MDLTPILDHPATVALAARFAAAGVPLYVVGGSVRDLARAHLAGTVPGVPADLDFTTPADPELVTELVTGLGPVWDVGKEFGTVGVVLDQMKVEVTTFRTESYTADSRKPGVGFTTDLAEDLVRRDLTINALAVDVLDASLADPFGGLADLKVGLLRTPGDPQVTMCDDPLRQIRVVRFAATMQFRIHPTLATAVRDNVGRLDIVARERVTAELDRLVTAGPAVLADALTVSARLGLQGRLLAGLPVTTASTAALRRLDAAAGTHPLAVVLAEVDNQPTRGTLAGLMLSGAETDLVVQQVRDAVRLTTLDPDATTAVRRTVRELSDDRIVAAAALAACRGRDLSAVVATLDDQRARYPQLRQALPVDGHDALSAGLQGPAIRDALAQVEGALVASGELSRSDALQLLTTAAA